MKFGQILVCCMTNISNMFLAECWRLETSSRLFYDFIKMTIQQDLAIFNGWHIPVLSFIHLFKKMKHWNRGLFGYWVIGAGCWIKKDLEASTSPPNCSKDYWKLLLLLISINWPVLVTSWAAVEKIYLEMHLVSWTNIHHDIKDLVNHGMVKNAKIWISWERKIIFLWNKNFFNLCSRWHTLRSYRFVVEVTFKACLKTVCIGECFYILVLVTPDCRC